MNKPKPARPPRARGPQQILLVNKPFGILSQFGPRDGAHDTLSSIVPVRDVYPVGRLDKDSEGLIVLSNDGRLQHRLANPKSRTPKTYWVQVEGGPTDEDLEPLRVGVALRDGQTRPAKVKLIAAPDSLWPREPPIRVRKSIPDSWVEVVLTEGRNRQVRRMTAAIGFPTLRLIRASIGPYQLNDLAPGQWQYVAS